MLDRRTMLLAGTAASALALASPLRAAAGTAQSASAALSKLFDKFMAANLDRSPITVTTLGLDNGARTGQKSRIDGTSLADIAGDKRRNTEQLKELSAFDRSKLTGMDAINYDVVLYGLKTQEVANAVTITARGERGRPTSSAS